VHLNYLNASLLLVDGVAWLVRDFGFQICCTVSVVGESVGA